ncbi:uncharacterized protein IL334_006377 [Kwoniella shivajii]|uniref:Uncharacterized protein n=1 Tax=Kwoniella shivajii TaxID=564305 RepID=A0ABZ1D646_9TREE|nr:hypothetical protein IL334_006377 [Kwoniella shivajii]
MPSSDSSDNPPVLPIHSSDQQDSQRVNIPSEFEHGQALDSGSGSTIHPLNHPNTTESSYPPKSESDSQTRYNDAIQETRTRGGRKRQATISSSPLTTTALGDLSINHPSNSQTVGRRRAHTIGVSLRPNTKRQPSQMKNFTDDEGSDTLTPLNNTMRNKNDLESGMGMRMGRERSSSNASRRSTGANSNGRRSSTPVEFELGQDHGQLDDEMIGLLDVIDPQVATVNHLQNMTNSVLIPHLPALWSRRPEVQLPQTSSDESLAPLRPNDSSTTASTSNRQRSSTNRSRTTSISRFLPGRSSEPGSSTPGTVEQSEANSWGRTAPIPIPENEVLNHGSGTGTGTGTSKQVMRQEMSEDIDELKQDHELDKHVKKILNASQKAKIKEGLKGLWVFVKTPMGFITAIYGFLVVFWGAAIVLFLLNWIPTNSKNTQDIWIEISSQVVNGLFTVTGVGLIPWRAMDTYRMSVIWTLKIRDKNLRKKQGLPPIEDSNDLPDPELIKDYVFVLSEKDQKNLRYQQEKFAISQTWYRAHATATHKAFPIKWALWNTILMDGNSFFQCILCGCMWGLNRHQRPAWTTGSLIPLSFLCGIGAAVLIWQGSARTKKSVSVSAKLRDALNVPVAIAIPRSKDGTVLNSIKNEAPATDIPSNQTESPQNENQATAAGGRRTTITFGDVPDSMGFDGDGKRMTEDGKSRERGKTIASPEKRSVDLDLDLGLGDVIGEK